MPGGASGVTLWPCMWAKEGTVSLHAVSRDKLESCVCAVMRKGRGGGERACTSTSYYILSHRNFPLPSPSLHPLVDLGHGRGKTGLEPEDDAPAVHELVLVAFGRGRDLGVRAVWGGGGGGGSGYSSCRRHTLLEPCTAPRSSLPAGPPPALTRRRQLCRESSGSPILLCGGGGGGRGFAGGGEGSRTGCRSASLAPACSFATGSCGLVSWLLGCGQAVKQ